MNFLRDYVFWAGWAKIEGRRHADPEVKSAPVGAPSATLRPESLEGHEI